MSILWSSSPSQLNLDGWHIHWRGNSLTISVLKDLLSGTKWHDHETIPRLYICCHLPITPASYIPFAQGAYFINLAMLCQSAGNNPRQVVENFFQLVLKLVSGPNALSVDAGVAVWVNRVIPTLRNGQR